MLDWIFEGIVTWISSVVSDMMDAVSGLFLQALGTDMTAMEEYFPFVSKAFTVMQYTAWALLFLITVWQLFRVFGGPVTEAENPWVLLGLSDRICKADFPVDIENRNSAVYGTHGHSDDGGGLYLCRNRAGPSKRADQSYRHHLGGRIAAAHHTGNCAGLELF